MPSVNKPPAPATSGLVTVTQKPALSGSTSGAIRSQLPGTPATDLPGSDFVILSAPKKQTVGIVFARDGHGKTTFATDFCPEPVAIINLDRRGDRAAHAAGARGRKIYYLNASMPGNVLQMSHEEAQKHGRDALTILTRNFELVVKKSLEGGIRTICIDTSTELRDIARVAVRGRTDRPQEKGQGDFGKSDVLINRTLKYFVDTARDGGANLILLARSKPIYDGREDTGRITWDTDKIFSQAADWIVELRRVDPMGGVRVLGATAAQRPRFEIAVQNPKTNIAETGAVYTEADWEGVGPFAYTATKLIPGSQFADWM